MGLEKLAGQRRSIDQIASNLSGYSQGRILALLSRLDAILEYDGVTNNEAQRGLAYGLLPDDLADRAISRLGGNPPTVIFSHQPLWLLEKLALVHADPDSDKPLTRTDVQDLTIDMLALADDLAGRDELESSRVVPEDAGRELTRDLFRNFMRHSRQDLITLVIRWWILLVDYPTRSDVRADPSYIDFPRMLPSHLGVDPAAYLTIGFLTLGRWAQTSFVKDTASQIPLMLAPGPSFATTAIGAAAAAKVYDLLSFTAREYAGAVQEENRRTDVFAFSFRTMREWPCVRYGEGILPLSQRFLKFKFTDGLLWLLREFAKRDGVEGRGWGFLGKLVEI
jgi:hypothetical protein